MHGRTFRSARVIIAFSPLVFDPRRPSVCRTHHYRTRIQFAGFERNGHFEEIYYFVEYPSKSYVIIVLCEVGRGEAPLAWYESRGTGRCFSSPIALPESGIPPPP